MKRLLMLFIIILLTGCDASVDVVVEEPIVQPEFEPEVIQKEPNTEESAIIDEPVESVDLEPEENQIDSTEQGSEPDEETESNTEEDIDSDSEEAPEEDQSDEPDTDSGVTQLNTASYDVCQVPHDNRLRNDYYEMVMGFPRPDGRLPNDRNIKAIVIFVEFPDYPASRSIDQLNSFFEDRYVAMTNKYIGAMSYGRVQHEFFYHDQIIMTEPPRSSGPLPLGEDYTSEFVRNTLPIADEQIDFSLYDYVIFHVDPTLPLSVASFAWANMARPNRGYVTEEKTFYNMNAWSGETVRPNHEWVAIHEIMHLYGLVDYYSRPENVWRGDEWVGTFDMMSRAMGRNNELLLWSRWFIGWVTPDDIHCFDGRKPLDESSVELNGTMSLEGTNGVLVRVSEFELILIERKERNSYCASCRGGLMVTRYDSSIPAMYGPLRIMRPEGSTNPDYEDALLYEGDYIEIDGLRIEVLEQLSDSTVISLTNNK